MRCIRVILLLLVGLVPSVGYGYIWYDYGGNRYAITQNQNTWSGAETEAEAAAPGGHLASIHNAAENAWLTQQFQGYYRQGDDGNPWQSYVWIGLHGIPDQLAWADGSPVDYVAPLYPGLGGIWKPLPPEMDGTEFGYLHTATHPDAGTWWNAGNDVYGIIEAPLAESSSVPEPSSLAAWFGLALMGLVMAWRRRNQSA